MLTTILTMFADIFFITFAGRVMSIALHAKQDRQGNIIIFFLSLSLLELFFNCFFLSLNYSLVLFYVGALSFLLIQSNQGYI